MLTQIACPRCGVQCFKGANGGLIPIAPAEAADANHKLQKLTSALEQYRTLHGGLTEMIANGRLTESAIPDDYQWLARVMTDITKTNA